MRLISVNVGGPREIDWEEKRVLTSIWKEPVAGPVRVDAFNLDGDQQSDLSVHGGARKSVYAYPSEHYEFWRRELSRMDLPWGAFGENFTIEGLLETDVRIGDRLSIGSAEFLVTLPRMPCYKLGIRLGEPGMVEQFRRSGRSGFYVSVLKKGHVTAGDTITVVSTGQDTPTVSEVVAQSNEGRSWKK
jgi:MOSC domain-containing protein YiiM